MGQKLKKPYIKPTIKTLEQTEISSHTIDGPKRERIFRSLERAKGEKRETIIKLLNKNTRRSIKDGRNIYLRNVSQEELDILRDLKKAGLNVEEPFSYTALERTKLSHMVFLDLGESLRDILIKLGKIRFGEEVGLEESPKFLQIYLSIFDLIGKMHTLGIEHKHPHLGNVTYSNGKVGLIDFSVAKRKVVDWRSSESIINAFGLDYNCLLAQFGEDKGKAIVFFSKLISNYPTNVKVKLEIMKHIKEGIDHYNAY